MAKDPGLAEQVSGTNTHPASSAEGTVVGKAAPVTEAPPVLTPAELWEQDSPTLLRITQLTTRNALLGEQLHKLRPTFQAQGKKK